jgi:hypothetical protein
MCVTQLTTELLVCLVGLHERPPFQVAFRKLSLSKEAYACPYHFCEYAKIFK